MLDIAALRWRTVEEESILFSRGKTRGTSRKSAKPIVIIRNEIIDRILDDWGTSPKIDDVFVFDIAAVEDDPANRLTKEYAGKGKAVFIEGGTFKTLIPLPVGKTIITDDTVNDTVNDAVKKRLVQIILQLQDHPGLRISELTEMFKVSEVTVKRDMQKIRPLVEFKGSQKTGGYFLTDYMLSKLQKNS
ncbi:hypothetical protein COR50_21670 [Chitinophaga caeni]|uniref:HTH deoR-type domain-containing protein n=1 Tax=Chitinophaga caeni TaxID=2029983 RepID=A0A291R080_9BACT|nr:DeoR family transcriptional regulator [Chitinophaga caeni]ATL49571.1 hypothetical protein COR50_21670 [Chitinophaga caeni]